MKGGKTFVEPKAEMKKRGFKSPDLGDAAALERTALAEAIAAYAAGQRVNLKAELEINCRASGLKRFWRSSSRFTARCWP